MENTMSKKSNKYYADEIVNQIGGDIMYHLESACTEGVDIGICTECEAITDRIEQDCRDGYCSECGNGTVQSLTVLAGHLGYWTRGPASHISTMTAPPGMGVPLYINS